MLKSTTWLPAVGRSSTIFAGAEAGYLKSPSRIVIKLRISLLLIIVTAGGCVTSPSPKAPPPLPDSVHWFRDSAEQKAVYLQTYRAAAASARTLSAGLAQGSWGVILDVDETILDNSEYQKRLALTGATYDPKSWDAWVQQKKASALPGARAFIDDVRDELHGQVVLVTNRLPGQCVATEENLRKQEIHYDRILCGDGDKNPRFQSVINGSLGTAPVNVLIWVGDNIQDFPSLTQQSTGGLTEFGTRYFVLPNPLYGSWQGVPPR
jgi:5'-nucleotidase (lipoprotein e(P4) family)